MILLCIFFFLAVGITGPPGRFIGGQGTSDSWSITIASADEPGEPLVVTGRVVGPDGNPMEGVQIEVYHTDAKGYYREGASAGGGSRDPRLRGEMTTNSEGAYRFRTIRPAPYPGGTNAAHIHYVIRVSGKETQYANLRFADDPAISESRLETSRRKGTFGDIQSLERNDEGILHCTRDLKIE